MLDAILSSTFVSIEYETNIERMQKAHWLTITPKAYEEETSPPEVKHYTFINILYPGVFLLQHQSYHKTSLFNHLVLDISKAQNIPIYVLAFMLMETIREIEVEIRFSEGD